MKFVRSRWGHLEAAKILVRHGADPTLRDLDGKTALDYAKESGYSAIVDLLEGRSPALTPTPSRLMP